jgi:hypothetical protein
MTKDQLDMDEVNAGWPKMDKTHFSIIDMDHDEDERSYWWSKTPTERLDALELMRQMVYGYGQNLPRIQRVLEVAQFPED